MAVAVLIMCNYLLVITWFPAVIVMHHQCSCAKRCEQRYCSCLQGPTQTQLQVNAIAINGQDLRRVERFLAGPMHKLVTHVYGGPALAIVLGCCAIALGVVGATIERSSATMLLLQESHICSQYQLKVTSFASTPGGRDEFVTVDLVFGVEAVDTGDHNDPDSDGKIAFDGSFDIADPAAQEFLLGLVAATRALSVVDSVWLTDIERFDAWLRAGSAAQCPTATDGLPLARREFLTCLNLWLEGSGRFDGCNAQYGGCGFELRFQDGNEQPMAWKTQFRTNVQVQDEWDYGER